VTPTEQSAKHVDVLLAAYKATKDEISRRSALTWTAVGAYLVFLFAAFKSVLDGSDWKISLWALSAWPVAILSLVFYLRELREIGRLSGLIREQLEPRLREQLGITDLGTPMLIEAEDPRGIGRITGPWQLFSDRVVFFGGPLAITMLAFYQLIRVFALPVIPYLIAASIGLFAGVLVCLLRRGIK
jgi:hypothetical protein